MGLKFCKTPEKYFQAVLVGAVSVVPAVIPIAT
jgi:hypothetical protein